MVSLYHAGTYRRWVGVGLARIWENVLDWEHLPALHGGSFAAVEVLEAGHDGWRVRLTPQSRGAAQTLRLDVDRLGCRYRVTTEAGPGAPSEIRATLDPRGPAETAVVVEYHVPVADPERREAIGAAFVAAYATLWDEDEAMMRHREAALAVRPATATPVSVALGGEAEVRQRLPYAFDFGPGRFRLVDIDGDLAAHGVVCPHWLGPLDAAPVVDGCVRCPWHGYLFDVATGLSADGRGLRLATAPAIVVEDGIVVARRA